MRVLHALVVGLGLGLACGPVALAQAPAAKPVVGTFYFPGWKDGALGLTYPCPGIRSRSFLSVSPCWAGMTKARCQ